jgi:Flp pilus assembly protein TadG
MKINSIKLAFKRLLKTSGGKREVLPLHRLIQEETGSAIVEFVALGLPLFLPLFIFLANVSQVSSDQRIVQNLARQVARAYVTAPDENTAIARVEMIKGVFQSRYFQSSGNSRNISISVNCAASPCLTLDSQIAVYATLTSKDGGHTYSSNATEIVDKWRNGN